MEFLEKYQTNTVIIRVNNLKPSATPACEEAFALYKGAIWGYVISDYSRSAYYYKQDMFRAWCAAETANNPEWQYDDAKIIKN